VLAVHGADVYVGFNHEQHVVVAASHDYAQSFSSVTVNPSADQVGRWRVCATVGPLGDVYFSWTAYARRELSTRPVSIYVSVSGCRPELEHGSAGHFERAAGVRGPRVRGWYLGADCAGVRRRWNSYACGTRAM